MTSSFLRILSITTPYRTSGASETIFMNFSVRSSRVTGPKIRVPIGSSLALSSTAGLPSKLIDAPARGRILDGHLDDVTDRGITALGAAEHLDAHDGTRAGIVGNVQSGLHLNHDSPFSNFSWKVWHLPAKSASQFWN